MIAVAKVSLSLSIATESINVGDDDDDDDDDVIGEWGECGGSRKINSWGRARRWEKYKCRCGCGTCKAFHA